MNSIREPEPRRDRPRPSSAVPQPEKSLVWRSAFGDVLIEVRSGRVYVNGDLVEPAGGPAIAESAVPH